MWDQSHGGLEQWTESQTDGDTTPIESPTDTAEDTSKEDETLIDSTEKLSFSTSISPTQLSESQVKGGLGILSSGPCDGCHEQFQLKLLKKCGWCFVTRYCSVACQRLHWKTHKNECHKVVGTKT
eukprot:TRINITY_DN3651_c0_g1_i6.p1 TRINITY_DN3651_c0_g1~~TRINITY_DN3651_c0_g1_i6.p1  ORF type:complete len:125 (+),score=5.39 TRINITY_DN3651_c0_g1_i6:255-629(+)